MPGLEFGAPLRPTPGALPPAGRPLPATGGGGTRFGALLEGQLEAQDGGAPGVRFSKHALARLAQRNIALDPTDLHRLGSAVARARAKGARESLVLLDDLALVVSVRNQTVITATDGARRRENVFTNIDSAVIA